MASVRLYPYILVPLILAPGSFCRRACVYVIIKFSSFTSVVPLVLLLWLAGWQLVLLLFFFFFGILYPKFFYGLLAVWLQLIWLTFVWCLAVGQRFLTWFGPNELDELAWNRKCQNGHWWTFPLLVEEIVFPIWAQCQLPSTMLSALVNRLELDELKSRAAYTIQWRQSTRLDCPGLMRFVAKW